MFTDHVYQDFDDLTLSVVSGFWISKNYNSDFEKNPESFTSLITDKHLYKRGSWKSRLRMSPGTRRFLIGFGLSLPLVSVALYPRRSN